MEKKYDSNRTIDRVLETAARLFAEKGFDKTSMQEIAAFAGISKGAIYHHFQSKEEIINKVKEKQSIKMIADMEERFKSMDGLTGKAKLSSVLKESLEPWAHEWDKETSSQVKSAEFIVNYMKNCVEQSAPMISRIIREGTQDGSWEIEYPDECAEVFILLLNIWCDPEIFECDSVKLAHRLKFLQFSMNAMGLDVITSEWISGVAGFLQKLYQDTQTIENTECE